VNRKGERIAPDLYRCCCWILMLEVPDKLGGKDADMLLKALSSASIARRRPSHAFTFDEFSVRQVR
jgi:hypothetical protein